MRLYGWEAREDLVALGCTAKLFAAFTHSRGSEGRGNYVDSSMETPYISIRTMVDFTNCWKKKRYYFSSKYSWFFFGRDWSLWSHSGFPGWKGKWKKQFAERTKLPPSCRFLCLCTFLLVCVLQLSHSKRGSEFLPILQNAALLKSLLHPKALQSSCTLSYWHAKSLFFLRSHGRNVHNLTFRILSLDHLFQTRDVKGF